MASGTCVGVAGLLYDCHKHIYFGRWTGKMESEKGRQGNSMQGVAWGRQKAFPFLSLPFPLSPNGACTTFLMHLHRTQMHA